MKSIMDIPGTLSTEFINLLIANKGPYIYYVQLTDELLLSTKKMPSGSLIMSIDKDSEFDLGPVTYIGEL